MAQLVIPKTLESRDTGDLVSFFESYDDIVQKNSGIHDSKCLTIDSLDPQCPIRERTFTKVKLTDESVDVVNLNKSWISMTITAKVSWQFDTSDMNLTPDNYGIVGHCLFVGLKSSSHIIDSYRIYNSNRKTACEQAQALHENTIVHFLKPDSEIQGRPNIYTPWENAFHHDESVCGKYICDFISSGQPFWDGKEHTETIEMELTIPLDDILPLSNISMYPNYLFGNLQLEFMPTTKSNFVWCMVNHEDAYSSLGLYTTGKSATPYFHFYNKLIDKCFYQCGDTVRTPVVFNDRTSGTDNFYSFKTPKLTVNVSDLTITSCESNINGFRIKDSVKAQLRAKYSGKKLIIPSQFIDFQPTNNGPSGSMLQSTTSYSLTNVSNICVTFPRSKNELTISRNPRLTAFQLLVDNKPYPAMVGSTTCARYCEYVLANSYLDNLWCGNKSLLCALKHNDEEFRDDVCYVPIHDNTNYCFNAATERLCSGDGIYCDGLNKDMSVIRLFGVLDKSCQYASSDISPLVFFVQTTFWVCTTEGVEYVMNDPEFLKRETEEES